MPPPTKPVAEFILSTTIPEQYPKGHTPEVAFLGRSNVGKSSLLNCLAGSKKLAFTSSQPGRTQSINFFRIGGEFLFADLPGYGFAKVPLEIKNAWQAMVETYLLRRETLGLCVLLLDSRRGWMEHDRNLREWLDHHQKRYLVVATKTDKLNQSELHHGLAAIRKEIPGGALVPFSAVTGQGAREIWQAIKNSTNR
ncbi:MAG: ribosome biogenesis GTP-binding protein YihA/YsxC [Acidobacteriota bacterium]|nr:ribosome biogenesis GTP-binding protein YihA/YsxC [Bryobacteraceae bacterium CoA2 C42]MCA2964838.1 YihA family ribosome biogenesis GTP-binding protein [Acidobacteriaceae bacterium]